MIQMRNVSNRYGANTVLKDINLSVGQGEAWVLFGVDDAGKTTLLHILMGYNTYYRGTVRLMGSRPNRIEREQREKIRYVPDDLLWEKGVTGEKFFKAAGRVSAKYSRGIEQKLCEYFAIAPEQPLTEMSYQDNKLVQIIAGLAARPELLILDEPMNVLEEAVWQKVLRCIRIFRDDGMALLIVANEYEEVPGICDHYAYLKDGVLVTGQVQRNTGCAKSVTIHQENGDRTGIYRGELSDLKNMLLRNGFHKWTIESLTLREELDRKYAGHR